MSTQSNPFLSGLQSVSIRRVLMIIYECDDTPRCYRELHPSQTHLPDNEVLQCPCVFSNKFAFIVQQEHEAPADLEDKCRDGGIVREILYEIIGAAFGQRIHIGNARSREAAQEAVTRWAILTSHHSRCLELSNTHLPATAIQHLEFLADRNIPTGLLFEVFRLPGHPAVGCELLCTPWTDEPIETLYSDEPQPLRTLQSSAGHPGVLVELLNLAAAAGVRYLIFDRDAPILPGLATFG